MRHTHFYSALILSAVTACGSDRMDLEPPKDHSRAGSAGFAGIEHSNGQAGASSAAHSSGIGLAGSGALGSVVMSTAPYGAGGLGTGSSASPTLGGAVDQSGASGSGPADLAKGGGSIGTSLTSTSIAAGGAPPSNPIGVGGALKGGNGGTVGNTVTAAKGGQGAGGATSGGPCANVVDERLGIFVDGRSGNDTPDCRSITRPCKTVQVGISHANDTNPIVYVAAGTYKEAITLEPGVRVEGGWNVTGNKWTPICGDNPAAAVVIQAPEGIDITAIAEKAGETVLSLLTIRSSAKPPTVRNQQGKSLYGIYATGASTYLALQDVNVEVADAGDGGTPEPVSKGLSGDSSCTSGDGRGGQSASQLGRVAAEGTFDLAGYEPRDGEDGLSGSRGNDGAAAAAPQPSSVSKCAESCSKCQSLTVTGNRGAPGCGGKGGPGGRGGKGGGSSIAVYAWSAHVTIKGGKLKVGNGGNASLGGAGAEGGDPSSPRQGATASCMACSYSTIDIDGAGANLPVTSCTGLTVGQTILGTTGGPGGKGGSGTSGGNGRGGSSCSILQGGGATVNVDDDCRGICSSGWPGNNPNGDAEGRSGRICSPTQS